MALAYDPKILQQLAERLEGQARDVVVLHIFGGFLVGGAIAGGLYATLQTGDIVAAVVVVLCMIGGWARGRSQAFMLRVEAQRTLCQMKIEENTRK